MLSHAAAKGAASIAIPALGTGNLGWPAATVAKTMYDAICEFDAKQGQNGALKDVRFVVYDKDIHICQVV